MVWRDMGEYAKRKIEAGRFFEQYSSFSIAAAPLR